MTTAMKRIFICGFALAGSLSFATISTIADVSKSGKKAAQVLAKKISGLHYQIRLVKSVEPSLDQASANIMHTWLFEPARDSAGNPVPVRVGVEVGFHRY